MMGTAVELLIFFVGGKGYFQKVRFVCHCKEAFPRKSSGIWADGKTC
jgi:hypothetical protein